MKFKCQEHYDKVAEFAKSIGDNTLQRYIEHLNSGRRTRTGNVRLNFIGMSRLILLDSSKGHPTDGQACRRAALSRQAGRITFPNLESAPRLEHTYSNIKSCKAHLPDKMGFALLL